MTHRNCPFFITILSLLAAIGFDIPAQTAKVRPKPVIRQVDHILVQTNDPRLLFDLFTDTLQLPIAWPIADYAAFTSGGVGAGNVNIEVLRPGSPKNPAEAGGAAEAHFTGIAFEPYPLSECLTELKARGIVCNTQAPYISTLPNGSKGALWTTIVLPQLSNPNLSVFLCEYNAVFLKVSVRREQLGNQLVLNKGGPLGVKAVKEVIIGTTEFGRDKLLWQKLMIPAAPSPPNVWQVGNGPAIHLVSAKEDRIQRIVLKVASLEAAKNFLKGKRLLGAVSGDQITMDLSRAPGLRISLAEK